MHRQFFKTLSPNKEFMKTHCKDLINPFQFACQKWYSYNTPECCCTLITSNQIRITL